MPSLRLLFPLILACSATALAQVVVSGKSALERDPKGWLDLMPAKGLEGWKRVPLAPDIKLNAKNPWSVEGKVLLCDGVGVKEMLLYDKEFTDGVYHVEWRFRKAEGKPDYNSGVYVRSADDGRAWFQVQVAHQDKPPRLGDIFGDVPVNGKLDRQVIRGDGVKRAKPPGEWNTYEIAMKGKTINVWVNGATTLTWTACPVTKGYVGLQAELYFIEFRELKFKESGERRAESGEPEKR
jgi:hypothetical protein